MNVGLSYVRGAFLAYEPDGYPDKKRVIYASTHAASPDCPMPPNMSEGYVWAIYPSFDIYSANRDGSDLKRLTAENALRLIGTREPVTV